MEKTDLTSHHIEGFAREGNTPFSMPLITQIEDNLWSGDCIHDVNLGDKFDFVVSLYPWEQFRVSKTAVVMYAPLYDRGEMPDIATVEAIADYVNAVRKIGPTLVHCQAGLNRSGLISALALIKSGHTPQSAITLLREKRSPAVLCNKTFP
jgi:hypothetical protein